MDRAYCAGSSPQSPPQDASDEGNRGQRGNRLAAQLGRWIRTARSPRRLLPACGLAVCVALMSGCNYFILLSYLISGPPTVEPQFDADTGKSMTDYEVTVAVVCYAPNELKWDFDSIDQEVAKYVSYRLGENKVQFVNPDVVNAWLDKNPDWEHPEEIGAALDVTYVIYIDLQKFTLYEEGSHTLYRGRSEALVSVYEMDDNDEGEKIWSKEYRSEFPTQVGRPTSDVVYDTFKKQYLSRLSEEIGQMFYEHFQGEDIPYAT